MSFIEIKDRNLKKLTALFITGIRINVKFTKKTSKHVNGIQLRECLFTNFTYRSKRTKILDPKLKVVVKNGRYQEFEQIQEVK